MDIVFESTNTQINIMKYDIMMIFEIFFLAVFSCFQTQQYHSTTYLSQQKTVCD